MNCKISLIVILLLTCTKAYSVLMGAYGRKINCPGLLRDTMVYSNFLDEIYKKNGVPFKERENAFVAAWDPEHFTLPTHHSNRFLYLVHGVMDRRELQLQSSSMDIDEAKWLKISALIDNPSLISEIGGISGSIINQDNIATFANSGFIIEPSYENIYATFGTDFGGLRGGDINVLERINEKLGIQTPEQIFATRKYWHNEIKLAGTSPSGKKLKVIGFYIKLATANIVAVDHEREVAFKALAENLKLPLIYILDPESLNPRPY